ncbi:hypothetical protein SL053_002657 [Flavobacterium psychrophilum]|nr:hypothetical protein [Flavobacterium psychrophilum]ELY2018725.1 hypothetical protein [Flavobacterium psychrophilum]
MKTIFTKATLLILFSILSISCSKDESSSSSETSTSTTITTPSVAKFTVATPAGVVKPNYIVMMFESPFSPTAPLPTIIKQATTDANGIATLDLSVITSTTLKTYYFEAFVQTATGYDLKTNFSRFSTELKKGSNLTTGLIVN